MGLTCEESTFDICTDMLYNAEPTVLVRTEPAFRLVIATIQIDQYIIPFNDAACEALTNDSMHVRKPDQQDVIHIPTPRMLLPAGQSLQCNHKREHEDLAHQDD